MKLRGGVEWALHICTLLAALPDDAVLHREQLAEFYELPSTYLAKQLQQLARAGIVRPSYGAGGGYGLGRPANQITVLDVVEAIDGDQASFTCTEIRRNGPTGVPEGAYSVPCTIAVVMGRADAAWRSELRRHTVADLAGSLSRAVPPAQRELAREWLRRNLRSRAPATP
ncbi:MAG TPA: Rrf2 family transcriptional regulator [Actinomycetes bacterium]|nr:Rrf2 family transcriptional regulator [Actinomycetes bacterium]